MLKEMFDTRKKILKIVIIMTCIVVASLYLNNQTFENFKEPKQDQTIIVNDNNVIMPIKASRPGCDNDNKCYIPSLISINEGEDVTWLNQDSAFHSVTSGFYESRTDLFDSKFLDPFESFTVTFHNSGVYDYFCTLHPWMKGQVVVE